MTTPTKIIALEGVGGSGKSTLAPALAAALGATITKRPLATPPPTLNKRELRAWMNEDCVAALYRAATATTPYTILDRHWLSACVYQDADAWPRCIAAQAKRHGEPDVWVIMSAPAAEIIHRLQARPADGRRHLDDPRRIDLIAGRIALYDAAPRYLKAPVVEVRLLPPSQPVSYPRIEVRSSAALAWYSADTPIDELAWVVARHVRALTEPAP